jgi:superfamily II helicase
VTKFGRAVAESFLTVDECVKIRKQLEKNELPMSIAVVSNNKIKLEMNDFVVKKLYPNSSFLSFENFKKSFSYIRKKNDPEMDTLIEKYSLLSKCSCIKPCTCGIQKEIIGLNLSGKSVSDIIDILENVWKIKITDNELIRYFDLMYYTFNNINNIGNSFDDEYCYKEIKFK